MLTDKMTTILLHMRVEGKCIDVFMYQILMLQTVDTTSLVHAWLS